MNTSYQWKWRPNFIGRILYDETQTTITAEIMQIQGVDLELSALTDWCVQCKILLFLFYYNQKKQQYIYTWEIIAGLDMWDTKSVYYFRIIRSGLCWSVVLFLGIFLISFIIWVDGRVSALRMFSISSIQASFSWEKNFFEDE